MGNGNIIAGKIKILLEMVQFKLTILALPFAFTGAFLAAKGVPAPETVLLIVLAMVGARTCAMGFNRIVDYKFDKANPRTAARAIPAGLVSMAEAWLLVFISAILFFAACLFLNSLTLYLSPFALGLALFYSLTKRFTSLCHVVLGFAIAFSPLGGWIAVTGTLEGYPFILSLGVVFWVAGFDIVYACLDTEFDKDAGLFSVPSQLGKRGAFKLASFFHFIALASFVLTGVQEELNFVFYVGVLLAAGALWKQYRLVQPDDLSEIHTSFFSLNGLVSVTLLAATWLSLLTA